MYILFTLLQYTDQHCGIQKEMDLQVNTIKKDKRPTLIIHHTPSGTRP